MVTAVPDPMETYAARPEDASYWGPPIAAARRRELLAALPRSAATTLSDLLDGRIVKGAERYAALPRCYADVGYPQLGEVATRLPERLEPAWRALLELSTQLPRIIPSAYAVPTDVWNLRRWLGMDPPGRLELPLGDAPLWRVAATPSEARPWSCLARLPLPERIAAFCEASLSAYRLPQPELEDFGDDQLATVEQLRRLGDPGRAVAPAMAAFLLRWLDSPDCYPALSLRPQARLLVLLALAAAEVPVEPAWDRLYPLEWDRSHELIERIPAGRRCAAIEAGARGVHPYYAEQCILRLLPKVPDPRLLALLKKIGRGGGGSPRRVIQDELARLGRSSSAVAALLGDAPPPPPHALTFRAVPMPPAGTALPELLRRQVSIPDDSRHLYTLFTAHDPHGKHVYDASLFCWDDGPVYAAGTTKLVARFVQGSAECERAGLADALDTALHRFRAGEPGGPDAGASAGADGGRKQPPRAKAKQPPKAKAKQPPKAKAKQPPKGQGVTGEAGARPRPALRTTAERGRVRPAERGDRRRGADGGCRVLARPRSLPTTV